MKKSKEISNLQYANAVFIERNSQLEKEKAELLNGISHAYDEINLIGINLHSLLGRDIMSELAIRGWRPPKELVEKLHTVIHEHYRSTNAKTN